MKKKFISFIFCSILFIFVLFLGSCSKREVTVDENCVIITVDIKNVNENATLLDYMNYLSGKGELEYEISNGMVISLEGISGKSNEYWMLYTNDAELSNEDWGTCVYEGVTYGSAIFGAESLIIKDGFTYIWSLQAF